MPSISSTLAHAFKSRSSTSTETQHQFKWQKLNPIPHFNKMIRVFGYKDNRTPPIISTPSLENTKRITNTPEHIFELIDRMALDNTPKGKTLDDLFKLEDLYDDLKQFYSESVISDLITLKCENLRNDTSIPQNQLEKRIIFYSQLLKFHTEQNTADTPAVNDLSQEDYNNSTNDLARTYGGKYKGLVESENMLQQVNKQNPDLNIAIPRFIGLSTQETEAAVKNERCPNKLLAFLQDYKNKPDIRFMVRSSSTQEDQSGQSNAGCYKTISNVNHSPEAILDAIKEVYQAFSSDNAHAQSALYSSNGNSSSPHQNHGAVLIQIMMGETNQNEPNTVSGVGLLPDPRSHAPGTFNLNAAPGHGEGIVQGKVTTDETIGVIDKKTQSVHARSRINNKPTRLTPNADANGLIKTENPQYLRQQAALSPESVETMALALNTLSERHKEGVDMEFVAQGHSHYLVQQRSQDARHAEIKPAYLKTASVEKYQAELHRVQVISHSNLGVNIIKPQERINAHSLDDAFYKDYLGMQKTAKETGVEAPKLKAVFVKPPAHPNAHAALMFRQQGIAIVQISDAKTYDTIATSSQSVLLDEQRGLLNVGVSIPEQDIDTGYFSYPAPAVYSLPNKKSTLSVPQHDTLKKLSKRAIELKDMALKSTNTLTKTTDCLTQLKAEIVKDTDINKGKTDDLLATLIYYSMYLRHKAKQNLNDPSRLITHKSTDQQMLTLAHELSIDAVRMSEAIQHNAPVMHKLLYLNWIEAALQQLPQENPETIAVASLKSTLGEQKTNQAFTEWFKRLTPSPSLSLNTIEIPLFVLHRLSYAIRQPELQARWLASVATFIQQSPDAQSINAGPADTLSAGTSLNKLRALAKLCTQQWQDGYFEAMLSDYALRAPELPLAQYVSHLNSNKTKINYETITKLKNINAQLYTLHLAWSQSQNFESRLDELQNIRNEINAAIDSMDPSCPFHASAISYEIGDILEQVDLALKSIFASQDYDSDLRTRHFSDLLIQFYNLSEPLLNKSYFNTEPDNKYTQNLDKFKKTFKLIVQDQTKTLTPTARFNVCNAIIDNAIPVPDAPKSIGDVHTLLHQNARMALGKLISDMNGLRCLPKIAQSIHNALNQTLPDRINKIPEFTKHLSQLPLTSITVHNGSYWQYTIPLRSHGFRIGLALDEHEKELTVFIAMDGANENHRYDIAAQQIETARIENSPLSVNHFKKGKAAWPNITTAVETAISWREPVDANHPEHCANRITDIIHHTVDTSYEFSEGTFSPYYDNIEQTNSERTISLFLATPQLQNLLESSNEKSKIKKLSQFLYPLLDANKLKKITESRRKKSRECSQILHLPEAKKNKRKNVDKRKQLQSEIAQLNQARYMHFPLTLPKGKKLSLTDLRAKIKAHGLAEGKMSLFEFAKVLDATFCDKPISNRLLNDHPDLFWSLSQHHLNTLDEFAKKNKDNLNPDFWNCLLQFAPIVAQKSARPQLLEEFNFEKTLFAINEKMNTSSERSWEDIVNESLRSDAP